MNVGGATAQIAGNTAAVTTISGAGTADTLTFSAALAAAANFINAGVNTTTATDLISALDLIATATTAANSAAWGVYGGNTYVVFNLLADATLDVGDQVVMLTGTQNLATSSVITAAGATQGFLLLGM